jgi:iron complex outermembrane receptor protein
MMGYFAFNKGMKSGQFDTFGTALYGPGPTGAPPVNPEKLYSYELGMKTEWLDHRIRLNADVFHYDISNLQFSAIVPGATKLLNAASAEINGLELDYAARISSHLTASGGTSLQYGHYLSFPNAPYYFSPSAMLAVQDASGEQTVRTPKFTTHIAVDYIIPRAIGDFDVNVNLTHTSRYEWFPDDSLPQPETDILNASILWTAPSGRYNARIWGSNILSQKYYSFGSESLGLGEEFSPAPPATFGITLGYHFV